MLKKDSRDKEANFIKQLEESKTLNDKQVHIISSSIIQSNLC